MKGKLCGTDIRRVATEANVTMQTVRNTFCVPNAKDHTDKQLEVLAIAKKIISQRERRAKALEKQLKQLAQS